MSNLSLKRTAAAALAFGLCFGGAAAAADLQSIGSPAASTAVTFENGSPRVLLVTDHYSYGVSGFPATPSVKLWVDPIGYDDNVEVYFYLLDRVTMAETFFNLDTASGNLVTSNMETPLFGETGDPILVPAPDFSGGVDLFGAGGVFGATVPGLNTATGHYAFVFELRSENGRVISRDNAMFSYIDALVPVEGTLGNTTWTANNAYLLTDQVFVSAGSTLTVQPGTVIYGDGTATVAASLGVLQGASINGNCTEMLPCRMTSALERSQRQTQDNGGIIVNGFAPTNQGLSPPPQGEGFSGDYGGNNPSDSSGVLRYWVVEYAGQKFNPEDELNCIALQGVGSGTVLENLQCIGGSDDGIEFFGGTANGMNFMLVNNEDDQLDWTFGWTGTVNNVCAVHSGSPPGGSSDANGCIEADNDGTDNEAEPRSNPTLNNFTCVRRGGAGSVNGEGVRFRRGTSVQFNNAVISNVAIGDDAEFAVWIDGGSSQAQLASGAMSLDVVVDGVAGGSVSNVANGGIMTGNSFLANGANSIQPQLAPRNGGRGCTTRAGDWTTGFWVQWDWGLGN